MRAGRTRVVLVAVVLALAVAWPLPPASAGPAASPPKAGPGGARVGTGPAWTLGGRPCRLLSTSAAAPVALDGQDPCGGIRPGAPVLTPIGQCTLNFLWRGTDGRDYIGTAGHCLLEGTRHTQVSFDAGDGPPARDTAGRPIGEFAYAALDEVGDFALIRLDRGVTASPEICRFGGPTAMAVGPVPLLTPLHHVGRGSFTGSLVPARTQLTLEGSDNRVLTGLGVVSAGDSGSPVVDLDGRAVGVIVATGPALALAPTGLFVYSMRIGPEMGRASEALGIGFDLVTAPLVAGGLLP